MRTLHESSPNWSKALLCSVLSVPRSSLYYRSQKRDEQPVKEAIQTTAGAWPRYGSQRVTAQMKRDGICFHDKPVGERRTHEHSFAVSVPSDARYGSARQSEGAKAAHDGQHSHLPSLRESGQRPGSESPQRSLGF